MKKITRIIAVTLLITAFTACKKEDAKPVETPVTEVAAPAHKIVSLNGAITEIVSALGHEKELVGVDVTSTYPESVKQTAKDLGHVSSISIESVIALQPTMILATAKDLTPDLIAKIKSAGIEAHIFEQTVSETGTKELIKEVAAVLHNTEYKALQDKIDTDLKGVQALKTKPKVLFIYARGAGTLMVAGKNTPVEKMIALAGGENATLSFEDYKPLTPEAVIQGNPDAILMFTSGLGSLGGPAGVLKIPGIDKTKAGKNKRIIAMDGGLLSGFGPRLGEAAKELNTLLLENAK
ncbi:heme/hemin ABC transporter substrate-binding protein [Flavobacterium kingsejongi]|uniref:Hemin ABC transporter substrate-binding protein n=1 Tax=Flavobacterium kingsejongi TaxID=1678728 RepID=A0A2S1LLN0_9FLAO|nr:ABC transporter substrate-binding protein [Flavobacterium kingsejongi]AWG24486.1 hemin ABC transporter substrate-binding protein [Flavobacterium kingsejongi]